ncbi:MAG: aminotransferase class I/II-fold pyridoxal phosphate-dependent enzyme [Oscillospiraceae bacterium]|nr:aminotransferase class I/II-fold pyridoxal phosphate-dependent enzyme [Oscillospiraceae bacterium]
MKIPLNPTLVSLPPSGIRRFFDIAAEVEGVLSLSLGEPDFPTPWHIREEGIRTLEKGRTWYSANAGLLSLRQAVAGYVERHAEVTYDPEKEILITVGGSEAIDIALRALINPGAGDEVLIPEPSFVCYHPLTLMAGGVPVPLRTREEDAFRLTADTLKAAITPRSKVLLLPYPNNPTGGVLRREHLEAVAEVIRGTDIVVITDEIYGGLTYGDTPHVSFAALPGMRERTVRISGFSKEFSMTGWRLGYVCAPAEPLAAMLKLHQYALMCAPTVAQYAAIEAMNAGDEDVAAMREEYDLRRRYIVGRLRAIGLPCFEPEGAFYVFPSVAPCGLSSEAFCQRLINEQKVAMVPGNAFGESGEGFVRISYCYSLAHITEAMNRLERFIETCC